MTRYYVVHVDDAVEARLVGDSGCSYVSPPQPRAQALALVRMLLGCVEPGGDGPWRLAIAGGRRTIALLPAKPDGQLVLESGDGASQPAGRRDHRPR